MNYSEKYIHEAIQTLNIIDTCFIEDMVGVLYNIKISGGRVFFIGVGGSAANCSHAVNDFRKILGIEAYAPTDNVSELSARTNDDGWSTVFVEWLKTSHLTKNDCVFVLSVGGGNIENNISPNIVEALIFAKRIGSKILGIVGRDGGYTKKVADSWCLIPTINKENITPHTEGFQSVILHLLTSHPRLKFNHPKLETKIKRAVFLDRDGVINEKIIKNSKPHSPSSLEEVRIYKDVPEAIQILKNAGLDLAVVTNQPDVARGTRTKEDVYSINLWLSEQLEIGTFWVCFHDNKDNCKCRKPKPGLILEAANRIGVNPKDCFMVGDRLTDIEAGKAAGCKTILIDSEPIECNFPVECDFRCESLLEAAKWIIQEIG